MKTPNRRLVLATFLTLLTTSACQDQQAPTTAVEMEREVAAVSENADPEAQINDRIRELFPQSVTPEAHRLFDQVKSELGDGDLDAARDAAFDLIDLALTADLEDPSGPETTEEALSDLIDLLFTFVGFDAPNLGADDLTSGGNDGVVAIAFEDQDNLILTENEFAGTFIESGDLTEDLLIVIERLDPSAQPGGTCLPLPADMDQAEGCYRFDRFPEGAFADEVRVGVCHALAASEEGFQLFKFEPENPGEGVVALPNVAFPELECGDFATLASAARGPWQLALSGWRTAGDALLSWLGPAPLRAVNLGFGGSTLDFSTIGWAEPLTVEISVGDGQTGTVGSPLPTDPTVQVLAAHFDGPSAPIAPGETVTFTVIEGGGTVNGGGTSTTTTVDANGLASTTWTIGSEGTNTNRLQATAGGDTAVFTASTPTIFAADFDDETAGAAPVTPEVGSWTAVDEDAGTIEVQASEGDLTDQPVVFDQAAGLTGGLDLIGAVAGDPVTSGVYTVTWRMLADAGASFGGVAIRDGSGRIVGAVALRSGGDITAEVATGTQIDTGFDWTAGVSREFELIVDLVNGTVSLLIDGDDTSITGAGFANASADGIGRIDLTLGGTSAQLFAFDDVLIEETPPIIID